MIGSCINFNSALLILITCVFTLNPEIRTAYATLQPRTLAKLLMDIIVNKVTEIVKTHSIRSLEAEIKTD